MVTGSGDCTRRDLLKLASMGVVGTALAGPSSAGFGKRNLVGMMGVMYGGNGMTKSWNPEYVLCFGLQQIDTGYSLSGHTKFKFLADVAFFSVGKGVAGQTAEMNVIGNYDNGVSFVSGTQGGKFRVYAGSTALIPQIFTSGQRITYGAEFQSGGGTMFVGSSSYALAAANAVMSNTNHIFLFTDGPGRNQSAIAKVFGVKMWFDDVLVRDYVPRVENGVVGMLDNVSGMFFDGTREVSLYCPLPF